MDWGGVKKPPKKHFKKNCSHERQSQHVCAYLNNDILRWWHNVRQISGEANIFHISIRGNDIDRRSATQWPQTAGPHCNTHNTTAEYSCHGKMLKQMTPERFVNTGFQCSQPLFFSPLVAVNNLGLRRFIALHSKCSRRIRVLWPSYWSNWEDVQQSERNS